MRPRSFPALMLAALALAGCHPHTSSIKEMEQKKAEQAAVAELQRTQIAQIPPPEKSRFMQVHTVETWENPWITVQPGMLELHITRADPNPNAFGTGGLLRPSKARQESIAIDFSKLAEAMSSIPQNAWPYGRVVAIEEAHNTPKQDEHTVRRNMEQAIATLNDLGIEVYDLSTGTMR